MYHLPRKSYISIYTKLCTYFLGVHRLSDRLLISEMESFEKL